MALLHVGASPAVLLDCGLHRHDCYEIIVNVEGEGLAEIGGREVPFSPGTIHVIPPRTPHRKRASGGFRDLYLHTDSLCPSGVPEKNALAPTEPLLLADDGCRTVEGLVSVLLGRTMLREKSDEVTDSLFDIVLRLIAEYARSRGEDPIINGVIHSLAASYSDPEFQVTRALLDTGYSKDHLRRRFEAVTGLTPGQYLKSLRMHHARQLLREKARLNLSVGEIAQLCGFYDPSYFCRSFQKETGMTPSAYAQAEKGSQE